MKTNNITKTIRVKAIEGTYDVTLEEVDRVRVFPKDEVIEIIAEAIHRGKLDMDSDPVKFNKLFNIYNEMARIALHDIEQRFDLTIKSKN